MSASRLIAVLLLLGPSLVSPVGANSLELTQPARVTALAVAVNQTGELVGANASITVQAARDGSGHVFMDTRPLSGTDLQGSARIAARVAAGLTGHGLQAHDLFFKIRSESPVISGPSAGSVMALAATVALENANRQAGEEPWRIREDVMATGTINPDGSIGPVGGILEKAAAAKSAGAEVFLVPHGQHEYRPRLPPEQEAHGTGPVNVTSYCRDDLNLTCRSVATLRELVQSATGRALPQPELGEPPSTALYEDVLGPRTRDVVDRAERVYETWDRYNGSDLPVQADQTIASAIQQAVDAYKEARDLWERQRFYSAASKAFQASIQEHHARLMLAFFEQGGQARFVEATIEHASRDVADARRAAQSAEVNGLQTVYTVGAGQQRVSDAERRIDRAWTALNDTGSASQALLQASWAFERARTVHWWLELSDPFGSGPSLPENPATLADEFINLARELIAYSESVAGSTEGIQQARDLLDRAREDAQRDFHSAALVEAAEAQVLASLTLETRNGEPAPSRVNASRRQAASAIQEARGLGVEPILPIAMFEFGTTSEETAVKLRFFRTANVLAGLSSVLTTDQEPSPSRFVDPTPGSEGSQEPVGQVSGRQFSVVGWAAVGMFTTLAAITLGMAIVRSRREHT